MKINYRDFPIIEKGYKLSRKDFLTDDHFNIFRSDPNLETLINVIKEGMPLFSISEAFFKQSSSEGVADKLSQILIEFPHPLGGSILFGSTLTYYLIFREKGHEENITFHSFTFAKGKVTDVFNARYRNFRMSGSKLLFEASAHKKNFSVFDWPKEDSGLKFTQLSFISLFIEYAETELKVLGPNQGQKIFNCKYSNGTNKSIKVYDSTWYTNLLKSGAFKVRGHFRLQPFGTGRTQKRLQWIPEHERGYTRKAGILKDQE